MWISSSFDHYVDLDIDEIFLEMLARQIHLNLTMPTNGRTS